jgi:two-component system NarL family sensor kinase
MPENVKYYFISFFIAFLLLGIFILLLATLYSKRQQKNKSERIKMKSQFQQELLQAQLEIQEQTLRTISQEIHDNIGQVLSLAKLNLNTMEIDKKEELQEKIVDSKKLVSKAIQDLRDLSKSMNTDNIEAIGLVKAIEYELEMIRKTGFKTEVNIDGNIIRLEPQKELILFRIIQEVLNNIIKHAEANSVTAMIQYASDQIRISLKDNGKGFDLTPLTENAPSSFGLGIRNMNNRARLINADFTISSSAGEGTEVVITVPLNNHNL